MGSEMCIRDSAGTVRLGVAVGDQVTRSGIVATIEATEAVASDDA